MTKLLTTTAVLLAFAGSAHADFGMVDFNLLEPVACRNFDDAIEASKFNDLTVAKSERWLPQLEFVKRHQVDSKFIEEKQYHYTRRVPSGHDCVVVMSLERSRGVIDGLRLTEDLISASQIKLTAPNLPSGMIAVCAVNYGFRMGGGPLPEVDCTGTGDPEKTATGYWIITKPKYFMRNFDLPKD
jgi:hypothetical protein